MSSQVPTPICTRSLSTLRWQVPRRIEMREAKRKRKRKGGEWKGTAERSSGIMATTLRSGLRAPKSRPVSMPGHRHSSSRGICYSPSLRLAPASLRLASARSVRHGTKLCRRPMPMALPFRRSPLAALTAAELLAISCCVSAILLS